MRNFLWFFVMFNLKFLSAKELKIVFWIDPVQNNSISNDLSSTLKDIMGIIPDASIHPSVLVVNSQSQDKTGPLNKFCKMISDGGVSAVIDFTYTRWSEGLDLVHAHRIPYLPVDRSLSPFMQMFAEFLQMKGANEVVLIFQNAQDKEEAIYQLIEGYPFRTIIFNAADEGDFVKRIRNLRPLPSYYAIFARGSNMNTIYEKLNNGKLLNRLPEWHFVFLDTRDRVFKYKKQVEYATKFSVNAKALCRSLNMKDLYCASGFTFQRALLLEIFRNLIDISRMDEKWLQPLRIECNTTVNSAPSADSNTEFDLFDYIKLSDFLTVSEPSTFEANDDDYIPKLTYMMNASINFYSNEHEANTDLALWQNGELMKINETISPAKRFFRIGVTEAGPWNYYRRDPHSGELLLDGNGNPIWGGYCIDFIVTLSHKLNFDYELVAPVTGTFGDRDPHTKEWDGLVGDLVRGETDFTVAAMKMYAEREEVIDFVAPYFDQTGISIVMRKPVRETSLFKFMTVLRVEVWFSILAALVATAVMLWFLDKYSPYSARNNKEKYTQPCREFTLRESLWFALTSFTPQGGGEAPKSVSARLLVAAYWLFVVLMLATFTANLAAFLTVERMQAPVQSLEQLARQSRINYSVVADSDTHKYFINMKFAEDTLYRMWKDLALNSTEDAHRYRTWDYPIKEQYGIILFAINGSGPLKDAAAGYRKVVEQSNSDFAFIHDAAEIKYEVARNCNLTEVGEVFAEQPYAIAVQQGSHLIDELSYAILELQKDRYFEDLKGKYWNSTHSACSGSYEQGITLESLGGVFIATLFGLGLALITLLGEVLYYKRKASKAVKDITKVKPMPTEKSTKLAWHTGSESETVKTTPPPSFEVATFRGRKVPPPGITLGEEFKPRRVGVPTRRRFGEVVGESVYRNEGIPPRDDSALPPYVE